MSIYLFGILFLVLLTIYLLKLHIHCVKMEDIDNWRAFSNKRLRGKLSFIEKTYYAFAPVYSLYTGSFLRDFTDPKNHSLN